jgi:hypothetical protein
VVEPLGRATGSVDGDSESSNARFVPGEAFEGVGDRSPAEAVSPELALVDPSLRSALRSRLGSYDRAFPDVFANLERPPADETIFMLRERAVPLPHETATKARSRRLRMAIPVAAIVVAVTGAAGAPLGPDTARSPASSHSLQVPWRQSMIESATTLGARHRLRPSRLVRQRNRRNRRISEPARQNRVAPSVRGQVVSERVKRNAARSQNRLNRRIAVWKPVRGASYYRIRVSRRASKRSRRALQFEVWTRTTRTRLPRTWIAGGRRKRLPSGMYTWSVTPEFPTNAARPTHVIAAGTFAVRG